MNIIITFIIIALVIVSQLYKNNNQTELYQNNLGIYTNTQSQYETVRIKHNHIAVQYRVLYTQHVQFTSKQPINQSWTIGRT